MKAALVFAAAASAANLPHHFRFDRNNSTAAVNGIVTDVPRPSGVANPTAGVAKEIGAGLTTLTILTTSVHTITSCAPTVPDCPADATAISALPSESLSTILVTDTIVLTSTVCPLSEASSISSSVRSDAEAGKITGTTLTETPVKAVPTLPTGTEITTSQPFETISTGVATATGPESSDKVVGTTTATVTQTTQIAVTRTFTVTLGQGDNTSVSVGTSVTSEASEVLVTITTTGDQSGLTTTEGTSTTTQTTKTTRTITVHRSSSTEEAAPVKTGFGNGSTTGGSSGNSGSNGECGCSNETVTVTVAAQTVYVTVAADSVLSTASVGSGSATISANSPESTDSTGEDDGSDYECDADEDDADVAATETVVNAAAAAATESSDVVVEVTATVVPTPMYPANGTNPHPTAFATGTAPGSARPTGHHHHGHDQHPGRGLF